MASFFFIAALCATFLKPCVSEKPSYMPMTETATADLKGQMFSLNKGGIVNLHSTGTASLPSFTVCLRYITENWNNQSFFAFGFGTQYYVSLIRGDILDLRLNIGMESVTFQSFFPPSYSPNSPWTALCTTWMSSTGMAQVWMNGSPSVRKGLSRGQVLMGQPFLVLYGFIGQIADLNLWNYVLAPSAIVSYSKGSVVQQGTVLNWRNLLFTTSGYVILEPVQFSAALSCCESPPSSQNSVELEESKRQAAKKAGHGYRNRRKVMLGKGINGPTVL
ncbi:hypothetical protein GJAV_G00200250 [Gymnothorax javanicus]|nr:hypothetical protein GJAV_G00200250 [Gymnothorax javanicus]